MPARRMKPSGMAIEWCPYMSGPSRRRGAALRVVVDGVRQAERQVRPAGDAAVGGDGETEGRPLVAGTLHHVLDGLELGVFALQAVQLDRHRRGAGVPLVVHLG